MAQLPEELATALAGLRGQSLALGLRRGDADAARQALQIVADEAADPSVRLEYVQILGEIKQPDGWPVLLKIAEQSRAVALRQAALGSLQAYDNPEIGAAVTALTPRLPPEIRPAALTLLASRPGWALPLLQAVASGAIERAFVPQDAARKLQLYKQSPMPELYARIWGRGGEPTTAEMQGKIERLSGVIRGGLGSPYEGQKLFMATCGVCHKLFGAGAEIGPDLTTYRRDDLDTMLLNIINPSAEIREGYENYLVTTKDGRTLSGFLADKDNQVVVLRGIDGQNVTLRLKEIEEMKPAGRSLMPEGLLDGFNSQQARDLFAYLRSTEPLVK